MNYSRLICARAGEEKDASENKSVRQPVTSQPADKPSSDVEVADFEKASQLERKEQTPEDMLRDPRKEILEEELKKRKEKKS